MINPAEQEQCYKTLDALLESWKQGDFVIGPLGFVVRFDPNFPLRSANDEEDISDSDLYEEDVEGLVILTQTCDVVRKSSDRPFLEVCPLVRVEDVTSLEHIKRGRIPRYAYLPGASELMLVADLDRVMTIEKSLLTTWTRRVGSLTDLDQRNFAAALARKRARFAFPDDFADFVERFRVRITQKHDKNSSEGACLRSIREIRVSATPSWDANPVYLMFWFIMVDGISPASTPIRQQCETWMGDLKSDTRFSSLDYDIVTLDEISAREYLSSDRMDLDNLSKTP